MLRAAWQTYDLWQSDIRVSYLEEPADLETYWRRWTPSQSFSPHVWNDAYLAAFAHSAKLELITFDKGFDQYRDANITILS
jgi:predicted nucleic acid-binding protein